VWLETRFRDDQLNLDLVDTLATISTAYVAASERFRSVPLIPHDFLKALEHLWTRLNARGIFRSNAISFEGSAANPSRSTRSRGSDTPGEWIRLVARRTDFAEAIAPP